MDKNSGEIQLALLKGESHDCHEEQLIHISLEKWAVETPNHPAVITAGAIYTYSQLNKRANQIARSLRKMGVKNNLAVGIMAERSFDMIAGIFGIWKAGGAYLPIDINYPLKRKQQIYHDSGVKVILTAQREEVPPNVELMQLSDERIEAERTDNLHQYAGADDLAYVIYTSGTTGVPKGVMIEHRALKNRIDWMQRSYPINSDDILIQKTTCSFDVSVWEIVWWTLSGAAVFLLQPRKESSISTIVKMIEQHHISVIHFVPSVFKLWLDYLETDFDRNRMNRLKYVFTSGESLEPQQVNRFAEIFKHLKADLSNLYGPTEAAIDVTYFNCPKESIPKLIPIGRPIQNTYCLILRKDLSLAAPNEKGELYLGGVGLARGYLNNELLTGKVFVKNPYRQEERLYQTGDIASYTNEGMILYHGREDEQVKLRGVRIELKEIEYYLSRYPGIRDSVVLVKKDSYGNQLLCAYLIQKEERELILIDAIKDYLLRYLPAYMIPTSFIVVAEIPLKPNGKADKKKLMGCCD